MKTQIVYALIASENDLFIEEIWASVYSLRLYEPDREVRVCCDAPTADRIKLFPELEKLITEVVIIPTPETYNPKFRSRHVKTLIREYVRGPFLYIDTDTIICGSLEYIDNLSYSIAGIPEGNIPFSKNPFREGIIANLKRIYGIDVTSHPHWINGGVIYAADDDLAHKFYKHWHENWEWATFNKDASQDMPGLLKAEIDMQFIMDELSGYYNTQPFLNMKYYGEAKIIHYVHTYFPVDQSFCPFFDKSIYERIHNEGRITPEIAEIIKHAKSAIYGPSLMVGEKTVKYLTSPVAPIFEKIYNEGGLASWLMLKVANLLEKIHKYTRKSK